MKLLKCSKKYVQIVFLIFTKLSLYAHCNNLLSQTLGYGCNFLSFRECQLFLRTSKCDNRLWETKFEQGNEPPLSYIIEIQFLQ